MSRTIVVSAGVLVSLALQGCGGGDAPSTISSTTTAKPSPDLVCLEDGPMTGDKCCCSYCGGGLSSDGILDSTLMFIVESKDYCLQKGGQCKSVGTSTFQRPPPATSRKLHVSELGQGDEGNRFQKHLLGGSPTNVQIVYLSNAAKSSVLVREFNASSQKEYSGTRRTYSLFQNPGGWSGYGPSDRGDEYAECNHGWAGHSNASCYYTSEPIHRVDVAGLTAGGAYEYMVEGDEWVQFKMPPALGEPIVLGFTADLGQTEDANITMLHMYEQVRAGEMDAVVFPGDLSYADGAALYWDSYGRMSEYLFGAVPTAYGVGNHEYNAGDENFVPFLARYGWPDSELELSTSPLWFSYDSGMAHVIMLCSYCDVSSSSPQIAWLQDDLAAVNRQKTPWVIASMHVPWYTSNSLHMGEGELMRSNFEEIMYKQVDFVVYGHVHAYERTGNVYKNVTDQCGPVHITIGDGGNHEGPACGWTESFDWSEKKETSFGYGTLNITSATEAVWKWYRNQDSKLSHSDSVTLTRPTSICEIVTV